MCYNNGGGEGARWGGDLIFVYRWITLFTVSQKQYNQSQAWGVVLSLTKFKQS